MTRNEFPTVLVWDEYRESAVQRIALNTNIGGDKPVLTVKNIDIMRFLRGADFSTEQYRHFEIITEQPDDLGYCECSECKQLRKEAENG